MAYLVKARVGRSQGAVIFWGLVSAFFASAFCYYYLENRNNEEKNRTLVDQVMILQGERDSLTSEREKLEAAASDSEKQMNEREQFLQEKETNLAQEEAQLEAMGPQGQSQAQQAAQAAGVKKFDEAVRKLAPKIPDADVIVRAGRPVLQVPSSFFFDPGSEELKPESKTTLNAIAQAATGTLGRFELRIETFTDSAGETPVTASTPPAATNASPVTPVDAWSLTGGRAAAIAHYLRDSSAIPFQNVIAVGRADFTAGDPGSKQVHTRNRRVEITIAPVPPVFHPPEAKTAHAKPGQPEAASAPSSTAPPSGPASP